MSSITECYMYVFPGQGSQYQGMGQDLWEEFAAARSVYERASEALGWDVAELSFRDPEEKLDTTAYTQPALLTHSIACMAAFRDLTDGAIAPAIVAGHSLGEYSALVASGALDFDDALRLVQRRGELMSEYGEGQMLAVPMTLADVRNYAERHYCGIGGCNLPNQTVIGGLREDLDALERELSQDHPRARVQRLNTEGAFHTYLMVKAAMHFRAVLAETELEKPTCRVLSNYTGDFHEPEPDSIRYRLFFQLFHPVRWVWGLQRALEEGVGTIIEFGGGLGGKTPADKRPNLAAIVQRTIKAREGRFGRRDEDRRTLHYKAIYTAAINVDSVTQSARLASSMRKIRPATGELVRGGAASAVRSYNLYLPLSGGVPLAAAAKIGQRIEELSLGNCVEFIGEEEESNSAFLTAIDPEKQGPEPYLEIVTAGESAALVYATGDEIERELLRLHRELSPPS